VRERFRFRPDHEFTFECYPDEEILTAEKLEGLRRVGVTRVSMGVQSLHDPILERNGRPARTEQFLRLYARARSLGFPVISLDFMSGMIGETWESWRDQIDRVIDLAPDNVSLYKLEFYLNSRLALSLRAGKKKPETIISDAEEARMVAYAFDRLRDDAGYLASNSTSLTRSRAVEQVHTKAVWNAEDLLGIGLSSYGIFDGYMYQNSASPEVYDGSLASGCRPDDGQWRQGAAAVEATIPRSAWLRHVRPVWRSDREFGGQGRP
jgi:oxygen-independent coproporphyrinogen-3 oxidase